MRGSGHSTAPNCVVSTVVIINSLSPAGDRPVNPPGQFRLRAWGGVKRWGMTQANLLTSVLFVLAHVFYHSPLWAVAVFVPSLVFGHFRDRVGNIAPSLALHVYYNMGFFCLGSYIPSAS